MKRQYIYIGLLLLTVCAFPVQSMAIGVTVQDGKTMVNQAKLMGVETKKAVESVQATVNSAKSFVDVGKYIDMAFSFDFNMPQPKQSTDAHDAIHPNQDANQSGAVGAAKSVVPGNTGEDVKFGNRAAVNESIQENMQVTETTEEQPADKLDPQKAALAAAGLDSGSDGSQSESVSRKRAQLAQSKQAFARYGLAVALVHRTLAYRTVKETKEKTKAQTAQSTTTRQLHEGKAYGHMRMAETYNRMLMSQAISNGVNAFVSMDEIEGKIDFNLRGLTDAGSSSPLGSLVPGM